MSLEKISHIISNAFKSATAVYTGSPDEKSALDALGGLAGLVEARARQSAHIGGAPAAGSATQKPRSFATAPAPAAPAKPQPAGKAQQSGSDDSYDLK